MKPVETSPTPLRGAPLWPLSVAGYHALGEAGLIPKNTELLYGLVYRKRPKSPYHCFLLRLIERSLEKAAPPGSFVSSEQPITCKDSEPEPDVALVKGTIADYRHEHPRTAELVIEICVTSHDYDRSKIRAYAGAGVKEVWLILAPERQIEIYRKPVDEEFTEKAVHGPAGRIASLAVPSFAVELDSLFAK